MNPLCVQMARPQRYRRPGHLLIYARGVAELAPAGQDLVSADEAAYYVRARLERPCSPSTIHVWAHRGRLQRHHVGRQVFFNIFEVHAVASASRTTEILA